MIIADTPMRTAAATVALIAAVTVLSHTQAPADPKTQSQLKQIFPGGGEGSPKSFYTPHIRIDAPGGENETMTCVAVCASEIEPLERGYDGPIKILVGMDTKGVLTGIVVVQHHEPYGDFAIERPEFAAQFKGKSIKDRFRVGEDVDAVSRATITITSAARAIRNSARRMATQLLAPPK
jgi:NosR/NirI family nitrous oxide reductase transcriptional regulator